MTFGRPDVACDEGNQFDKKISGQAYLKATPSKFDEPQKNIEFFTQALGFTKREMVALYGAHTLGGLNSGVIPYGSLGGVREAPFCADRTFGGRPISENDKHATTYDDSRSITRDSPFFDVWFDETPGTFDEHYFKQMIDEYDSYTDNYQVGDPWASKMNSSWTGAHGIAWDLNENDEVGHAYYPAPDFPLCGQSGGTLLGTANSVCRNPNGLNISQSTLDTIPFSCPHWTSACNAGNWCRHIPGVNHPNQANIKSLKQWTVYGGRKGRVATLPSDWALLLDEETRDYVREFSDAGQPEVFHRAFAEVLEKMVTTGHTGLQTCSAVDCSIDAKTFSCRGLELNNCDSAPQGTGCRLVGAFGFQGEVSCDVSGKERLFRCALHESDHWNTYFQPLNK